MKMNNIKSVQEKVLIFLYIFILINFGCFPNNDNESLYRFEWKGKYGYIDNNFNIIIEPIYIDANQFVNNIAIVKILEEYIIINKTGKTVKSFKADEIINFRNSHASFRIDNKWSIINEVGTVIISDLNKTGFFSEGLAAVKTHLGWTYINSNGDKAFSEKYFLDARPFDDGIASIKTEFGWTWIDKNGNPILKDKYFYVISPYSFKDGLAAVKFKKGGKYGFVNKAGKTVIQPNYTWVYRYFSEGLCGVKIDKETFYINTKGKKIITNNFETALQFYNGVAFVGTGTTQNSKYSLIDSNGNYIFKDFAYRISDFSDDVAAFQCLQTYKWGYVDTNGEIIIKPQFTFAYDFIYGLAEVWISQEQGFVDKKGNITWIKDIMKN